ncbi:MAG: phosphoserine phosphatase SerB [Micrococcales bacterium]
MTKFLIVFDVDSTLIQDEVIELLADVAGRRAEVAAITERAMAGELDFAASLIERVATLAGLDESVFTEVLARVQITPGAKQLIDAVHAAGGRVGAVSGGFSQVLDPLSEKLTLDFARANLLEVIGGKLTGKVLGKIIDRAEKKNALLEWATFSDTPIARVIAVGDGANDLEMMSVAGLSVAFNAKPIVRQRANLVIQKQDLSELISLLGL